MQRLLEGGLDRHDAIHAIGSAVAQQIFAAIKGNPLDAEEYERSLNALTAATGRASGKDE
jgi:hypothetical protein